MIHTWKIIISIFLFAFCFNVVNAQSTVSQIPDDLTSSSSSFGFDTGPTENDLDLTMTPENPGAFEKIDLQVSSDYINLSRYQINWFVNGTLVTGGIGLRTFSTQTKNYGDPITITLEVKISNQILRKNVKLAPEDMTLLWEAIDSYVPPFYEGKRLPSREALIKVVSMPNFSNTQTEGFDPRTGIYGWKRNSLPVQGVGGYGKNYFIFQHNKIRGLEDVAVTAQDIAGNHSATKNIILSFYDPKILFYTKDQETGLRDTLSKITFSFFGNSTTLEAEPYFFSVLGNNPNSLNIKWTLNGQPISLTDATKKTSLVLQNPGATGVADLGVSIDNSSKLFQSATSVAHAIFK